MKAPRRDAAIAPIEGLLKVLREVPKDPRDAADGRDQYEVDLLAELLALVVHAALAHGCGVGRALRFRAVLLLAATLHRNRLRLRYEAMRWSVACEQCGPSTAMLLLEALLQHTRRASLAQRCVLLVSYCR